MASPTDDEGAGAAPNAHLWSRDGFLGANAVALRTGYTPTYLSANGPHAPRRLSVVDLKSADYESAGGLPMEIMTSKTGVKISVSRRREPMPFTIRNAEADELHFVQSGRCRFDTDFGSLEAGPHDFVGIPKAVSYRVEPLSPGLVTLIVDSPEPLIFDTPAPFGMVNFGAAVRRAAIAPGTAAKAGPHTLLIKSEDGITQFEMAADPLPAIAQVGGAPPVWALNLASIVPVSYGKSGGPPAQFLSTADTRVMLYSLSARPGKRPPVHHNADYDELVFYVAGPGAWGKVSEPGTLTWVPKAVTHHGPSEDVPEGYLAWLLETRSTMRFTPAALEKAAPMETGLYDFQPKTLAGTSIRQPPIKST
jgi:homogentisate 1,2-dioxygenase